MSHYNSLVLVVVKGGGKAAVAGTGVKVVYKLVTKL